MQISNKKIQSESWLSYRGTRHSLTRNSKSKQTTTGTKTNQQYFLHSFSRNLVCPPIRITVETPSSLLRTVWGMRRVSIRLSIHLSRRQHQSEWIFLSHAAIHGADGVSVIPVLAGRLKGTRVAFCASSLGRPMI